MFEGIELLGFDWNKEIEGKGTKLVDAKVDEIAGNKAEFGLIGVEARGVVVENGNLLAFILKILVASGT
jgi:hypothetical protein